MEAWNTLKAKGAEVYLVGGSVRDHLLGLQSKDQDILIRNIPIKEAIQILEQYGRVEIVGASFQILKFICNHIVYDITFPRKNIENNPTETFPEGFDPFLPLEADLLARDFTINAMAKDYFTGIIIDPANGIKDIKDKIIRMTSQTIFKIDPLRILRAAQLAARLEFTIEENTLIKMQSESLLLKTIPPERIMEEISKTLTKAKNPSIFFDILNKIDLLETIFPSIAACSGIQQNIYHAFDVCTHTMKLIDALPKNLELRLAGLYHDTGKKETQTIGPDGKIHFYKHETVSREIAKKELSTLRFSNDIINFVSHIIMHHLHPIPENHKSARRFISKIGPEFVMPLITLMEADSKSKGKKFEPDKFQIAINLIRQIIEEQTPVTIKQLAITGREILNLGVPEGPLIGKILSLLLDHVVENPNHNEKKHLLEQAQYMRDNLTL